VKFVLRRPNKDDLGRNDNTMGQPREDLKETAKAAAGTNWPSKILEEAVKPMTIPDP
jgi:hypothetical protein